MVKRQDEVQGAVQVPTMLFATWVKVLSYIPFWTPTLMLVRLGLGTVAWWEIAFTTVLILVAISACAWFSTRTYRLGILMHGQRSSLRQLGKMVRMKGKENGYKRASAGRGEVSCV